MVQTLDGWLKNLSPMTRHILVLTVVVTALASLGPLNATHMLLMPSTLSNLELWRPITAAFYFGDFSFNWLITMAMFVTYCEYNEKNDFNGKMGDFAWMLVFLITALTIGGLLLTTFVTSYGLLMSLCWVFCKRHPEVVMKLYVFEFNANVFPWVLLAFHFVVRRSFMLDLLGIVVGHIYFFLRDILPKTHRRDLLRTPTWFLRYVMANSEGQRFATLHGNTERNETRPQTHRWGTGRPLGNH